MTDPAQDPTDAPTEVTDSGGDRAGASAADEQPIWSQIAEEGEAVHSPNAGPAAEENPYPRLQIGDPDGAPQTTGRRRRPSSLSAHINSAPRVPQPPLQQPLPEKYTAQPAEQLETNEPVGDEQPGTESAAIAETAPQEPTTVEAEAMTPSTPEPTPVIPVMPLAATANQPPAASEPNLAADTSASASGSGIAASEAAAGAGGLGEKLTALRQERPEVLVAVAFAGGLILASILKRLARR